MSSATEKHATKMRVEFEKECIVIVKKSLNVLNSMGRVLNSMRPYLSLGGEASRQILTEEPIRTHIELYY